MTDRTPSLMQLHETDRVLDELAAGRIPREAANDPVLGALTALAAAVDDVPMPEVAAPATTHLAPRGPSRSRHLAAVLAIGITLSSSGIAAAVTGDPLLPIKTVVKNVYEIGHHDTSKSDWILGGRDGVDRTLRETFGINNLTSRSQTRATDGLHNAHGRTPMEIRLRDDPRRDSPNDRSTNPAAAPGAPVDDTDETPPTVPVPATSETPGQTTAPGQPDDTGAPDGNTNGSPDGTGKPDRPHHANNGGDNPGKPETNPGVGAGSTDDPDGCSTDSTADLTTDQQANPDCPTPRPSHPTRPAPKPQKPTDATTTQTSVAAPAAGRDG